MARRLTAALASMCLAASALVVAPTAHGARPALASPAASAPAPLDFELVDTWGGSLSGVRVGGFAFDGDRVLATDVDNGRIVVKTPGAVTFHGSEGSGNSQFNQPIGIAIRDGLVVVADALNDRVKLHELDDLTYAAMLYQTGHATNQVEQPMGVATSAAGDLYVMDAYNYRIHHAEPGTVWSRHFGGASSTPAVGQFFSPWGVTVTPDGFVWASDSGAGTLTKFTRRGVPVGQYGARDELLSAAGIGSDSAGRLYVARQYQAGVAVLDASGTLLATIGGEERLPAEQVLGSFAVGIDPAGTVYVGTSTGVKVFRPVLAALEAPVVKGTGKVGSTLTATPGRWPVSGVSYAYQWLREGAPVAGATSSSYALRAADAGKRLSVRVTASRADYAAASSATSGAVRVAKITPKVTAKLAKTKVKTTARARLTITVRASGVSGPTGKVQIFDGKKRLRTVTLKASHRGKLTVKLSRLKAGKHKIKVTYLGSSQVAKKSSKRVSLRVVR